MHNPKRMLAAGLALSALSIAAPTGALAQDGGSLDEERCVSLRDTVIDAGFVTSARAMDAVEGAPAYCEVRAVALPAISIEVRLPMEDWNGKLYQVGCGGFCGILGRADASGGFVNAMGPGLAKGYATATSDSGHHGMSVIDAGWAYNNPHAERDWGWRSIGETNRVARSLIKAAYETETGNAYFQGCSTGGRMANRAALQYPEMFQGIISGAPAMDYPGLVATKMAWIVQANTGEDGEPILKPGKEGLIGGAVMDQCDDADGKKDSVIDDPRQCNVDLSGLQCGAGGGNDCLTEAELGVIEKWRQGPRNSAGDQLYPGGIPEGSEPFWWLWLTGKEGGGGKLVPLFGADFVRYMAFANDPGPDYKLTDFDFDTDPPRLGTMSTVYNGDDPDLSKFREAGGKMIVWHGWADAIVTPYKTVEWYDQVAEKAGGQVQAKEFVRLFMIPGMDHCGILPGPGGISQANLDPLTALENWVENDKAPETVLKQE